jgi:hypothetical protein
MGRKTADDFQDDGGTHAWRVYAVHEIHSFVADLLAARSNERTASLYRCTGRGWSWKAATAVQVYAVHEIHSFVADLLVARGPTSHRRQVAFHPSYGQVRGGPVLVRAVPRL